MAEIDVVLKRQWDMLQELTKAERGLTLAELAEKFDVSEKTIKRDVKSLESVFGKMKTYNEAHGRKRYMYDRNPFSFGLTLDRNELLALYVGQSFMTPLKGTFLWEGVQSGREKIKQILREDTVRYAERVAPFFYRFEPTEQRYSDNMRKLVDESLKAMEDCNPLTIRYRSQQAKRIKQYEIHPYNFVYWRGAVYLVGFCTRDKKIKIWKVDRLSEAKALTHKHFKRIEFDVEKYLANVVAPYVGDAPVIKATIRFTGYAARIVTEEKLKNSTTLSKSEDGLVVQIEIEAGKAFMRWVLGFGYHAEILAPPNLRAAFLKEVKKLETMYSSKDVYDIDADNDEAEAETETEEVKKIKVAKPPKKIVKPTKPTKSLKTKKRGRPPKKRESIYANDPNDKHTYRPKDFGVDYSKATPPAKRKRGRPRLYPLDDE